MTVVEWLRALRGARPAHACEIRSELQAVRQHHTATVQQRDRIALDAVDEDSAAARWRQLDQAARECEERIELLSAALPLAEVREAEAARAAKEQSRQARIRNFERQAEEAQEFIDGVLASLPTGEDLTKARELRDALRAEAAELRAWSDAIGVRRPLDPLDAIHAALALRTTRIERSRLGRTRQITLDEHRGAVSSKTTNE